MSRALSHKLQYFIRILQLITTFKINHNFACEIIYVEIFRLSSRYCFVCILTRSLRWYPMY